MSSTGTYTFSPSAGDLILHAFGMIQVRRWELTAQHLIDAYMQANMLMVEFSNRNPNTWDRETQLVSLTQGVPTYSLTNRTLAVVLASISTTQNGVTNDRVIGPLSMNDYASLPTKLQQGPPTSFMFQLSNPIPTITFWPVPDGNGPYVAKLETFRQQQDVQLAGGVGIDSPYRFLDAFATGLAYRLGRIYPPKDPNTMDRLKTDYLDAFGLAAQRDQEGTNMYIRPIFTGYFR